MRDFRYAVRVLVKSPVFTVAAILTLALCIGVNATIYTVVDRVLLRPLPYPHPERLAMVMREYRGNEVAEDDAGQAGVTWEALIHGAAEKLDFALTASSSVNAGVNFAVGDRAEYVRHQRVSANYFRVLSVAPELGREFTIDEDRPNGPPVAILSHALWVQAFNGDPAIMGKAAIIRGEPHTIIGVMPASLATQTFDLGTPAQPAANGEGGGENYGIIARLRDGVTWSEADALVASATASLVRDRYGRSRSRVRIGIVPLQRGEAEDVREPLIILWAAVGTVLLIGCVNIAGLLLARSNERAPEVAVRMALGANRAAIVRQLLTESVVLGACGGVLGLAVGGAGARLASTLLKDAFGITGNIGLDMRVVAVTAAAALATSVIFGLLPALYATRVEPRDTLVEFGNVSIAGTARSWPRRLIVVSEVALSVVLLVGAGLLIRTFDHLTRLRPGFDGTHVMTATLSLQDARYRTSDRVNQLVDRTLLRMHEVPGVDRAAVALTLPYERALNVSGRWVGAKPGTEQVPLMNLTYVSPEYFEALRVPLVRGRVFTPLDTAISSTVIIVNEAFVRRSSSDEEVLGRQIVVAGRPRTVIGVAGDIQQKWSFGNNGPIAAVPASYIPVAQTNDAFLTLMNTWFAPSWFVRTSGPEQGIVPAMQRAVASVDPMLPFAKFRTLDDVRAEAVATERARATLLATFAGLALLLAGIGLYGLVASSIAERTRELGIRVALGATPSRAIATVTAPSLVLAAAGIVVGLVAARAGAQMVRHLVWGISVVDATTLTIAAVGVAAVATIATLAPALRIARLNPIQALRT